MDILARKWAIIRHDDKSIIEGGVYSKRSKANRRKHNCNDPEKFDVVEVVIMPIKEAEILIDAAMGVK